MARRKPRKRKAAQQQEPHVRLSWVTGLTFVFAITGFFLSDFYGVPFHFTGAYVWVVAFFMSVVVTLFYLAQFTLPLNWQESWLEGLRLTVRYNFPFFAQIVRKFFRRPAIPAAIPELEPLLPDGFKTHRAGIVPSHQVYALTRGPSFVRVVGPGYARLTRGERISQIIELRRQMRERPVEALTRDGIPLQTSVKVGIQVKRPDDFDETDRLPYPIDPSLVFHINYLNNFGAGDRTMSWSDLILREAHNALISELSNYTLDRLFQPEQPGILPLEEIKQKLKRKLEESFAQYGVSIYTVSVGQFQLPTEVPKQRIEYWRKAWEQRIETKRSAGEAEAMRRIKLARARAQIEIIERITDSIEAMRRSGESDLTDIVALRMLDTMERAMADDTVKALVPQYMMSTLNQVNRWLQEGERSA
jgi:hypothetical protein